MGKYDFSSHKLIQFKDDEPLEFTRRNAQSSHLKIESRSMIKNRLCCKQQNYISSCIVNIPSSNIVNFSLISQFSESYLLSYWMSVLKFQSKPLFSVEFLTCLSCDCTSVQDYSSSLEFMFWIFDKTNHILCDQKVLCLSLRRRMLKIE